MTLVVKKTDWDKAMVSDSGWQLTVDSGWHTCGMAAAGHGGELLCPTCWSPVKYIHFSIVGKSKV